MFGEERIFFRTLLIFTLLRIQNRGVENSGFFPIAFQFQLDLVQQKKEGVQKCFFENNRVHENHRYENIREGGEHLLQDGLDIDGKLHLVVIYNV